MSDMKCPICGQELKNINFIWFCENESCRAYDWTMEESAWQELIRTRKALDVAVKGLKHMRGTCLSYAADYMDAADNILEQITALEQKDVK